MGFRVLVMLIVSCIMSSWVVSPAAFALTQIKLLDVAYQECPADLAEGSVSSGTSSPVNCFLVTGKAQNTSGKMVYDADVFGRIYDANNNSVMENRTRLGLIPEVPPGLSDFSIRISVAADQPTPLKLEQFKARGFASKVRWDQ
ncbi:MAG: hypothetical protein DSM107014_05210 [Gomphosphaeria aponina SAG 52.96 = DSM 107014]|uniref:Biotin carboxylase n=1 Tax=Gomphosphaeria aponina SAG 52.96 = DSM 107014 TaxID=1521640 RepID=A0A941JLN4_9CHRO|nr:hypothetical protein [Gomphosphaeria aponina SAG 52.96 = DSM 107014]